MINCMVRHPAAPTNGAAGEGRQGMPTEAQP